MQLALVLSPKFTVLAIIVPFQTLVDVPGHGIGKGADDARAVQLAIEDDPQPPFDPGSTAEAPPEIIDLLTTLRVEAHDVA